MYTSAEGPYCCQIGPSGTTKNKQKNSELLCNKHSLAEEAWDNRQKQKIKDGGGSK